MCDFARLRRPPFMARAVYYSRHQAGRNMGRKSRFEFFRWFVHVANDFERDVTTIQTETAAADLPLRRLD